jgi:hypothetical protein
MDQLSAKAVTGQDREDQDGNMLEKNGNQFRV